jgi:hypothetical protein
MAAVTMHLTTTISLLTDPALSENDVYNIISIITKQALPNIAIPSGLQILAS